MLLDINTGLKEAKFLHGQDATYEPRKNDVRRLYFSIFKHIDDRPCQTSHLLEDMDFAINATQGCTDTYLSQASFNRPNRRMINFSQVRASWLDLDIHNFGGKPNSEMVDSLERFCKDLNLCFPTAVIGSGRGIYLKWNFNKPIKNIELPKWQAMQLTLTCLFHDFGADYKARDASRILRVIGTVNSKSGTIVQQIDGTDESYEFDDLCARVEQLRIEMLDGTSQFRRINGSQRRKLGQVHEISPNAKRGDATQLTAYIQRHEKSPEWTKRLNEKTLNWSRFCDLRDLFVLRGGIAVGERDQALLWMLVFLCHSGVVTSSNWSYEITELLKAFPDLQSFDPLKAGYMNSLLQRLKDKENGFTYVWKNREVDPLYRASNSFLIYTFNIRAEEMPQLSTIISPDEKRSRVDVKNEGRAEARDERIRWRIEVEKVFDEEMKAAEAAAKKRQATMDAVEAVLLAAEAEVQVTAEAVDASDSKVEVKLEAAKAAPIHIKMNLTALSKKVGAERSRVSRHWNDLVKNPKRAKTVKHVNVICDRKPLFQQVSEESYQPVTEFLSEEDLNAENSEEILEPVEDEKDKEYTPTKLEAIVLKVMREARAAAIAIEQMENRATDTNHWSYRKVFEILNPNSVAKPIKSAQKRKQKSTNKIQRYKIKDSESCQAPPNSSTNSNYSALLLPKPKVKRPKAIKLDPLKCRMPEKCRY